MRTSPKRWTTRIAFVLACLGLVASVDASVRVRTQARLPRTVQRPQPQPSVVTRPRPVITPTNPIVRIDGTNYRISVRVVRYLPGILADGQTAMVTVPQVSVSLTRADGRAITRPLIVPVLQLGHAGDQPVTISLIRAVSSEPQSALWIGEGVNNWANDVQLRARIALQTTRGTITVNTIADYQIISAP